MNTLPHDSPYKVGNKFTELVNGKIEIYLIIATNCISHSFEVSKDLGFVKQDKTAQWKRKSIYLQRYAK